MSAAEPRLVPDSGQDVPSKPALQAPVLVTPAEPLTITVDVADALSVGLTLEQLIRQGYVPPPAVAPFARLGSQLVAAARVAAKAVGR